VANKELEKLKFESEQLCDDLLLLRNCNIDEVLTQMQANVNVINQAELAYFKDKIVP